MLQREKQEKDLCGDYELIYPIVSHEEEYNILDQIKAKEDLEKQNGLKPEEEVNLEEYGKDWQKQQQYCNFMEKAK